jgi:hypothetical protein
MLFFALYEGMDLQKHLIPVTAILELLTFHVQGQGKFA